MGICNKNDQAFADEHNTGLTKREYFAAAVMVGFCAHPDIAVEPSGRIARYAVEHADALIEALNRDAGLFANKEQAHGT